MESPVLWSIARQIQRLLKRSGRTTEVCVSWVAGDLRQCARQRILQTRVDVDRSAKCEAAARPHNEIAGLLEILSDPICLRSYFSKNLLPHLYRVAPPPVRRFG